MTAEPLAVRAAVATIAATTSAMGMYAVLRVAQSLLFKEADPALVLYSEHAGYFWRAWTSAYIGGMVAFVAYVAARRDPSGTLRIVTKMTFVSTALALLQGVLVP